MEIAIKNRILNDIKEAMKAKDSKKRDALRTLHSALKQVEIDKRIELNDEDCLGILKTALKQREDARESYQKANRDDLAEKENYEINLIMEYMPKQIDDVQLDANLRDIIARVEAKDLKDLGKVMAEAKSLSSVATNKRIADMAKKLLSS
ncbi:GatB/YqeY domain-containing protein [Helicobacter muridarum]|uniref:GatB/Yqey family protein n=1 Tax=Helicobacter muridarum TaxID=216 RepID=A0A377PTA4_9HELI|nr:GatB/YqeY domain-containing protein [Helicobacter muridarum]STQ85885.1 GatB/Yqey family protein [Helicobacter muridarum]